MVRVAGAARGLGAGTAAIGAVGVFGWYSDKPLRVVVGVCMVNLPVPTASGGSVGERGARTASSFARRSGGFRAGVGVIQEFRVHEPKTVQVGSELTQHRLDGIRHLRCGM